MREPTASVPMRLRRLQTFCPPRIKRKKIKQKEQEQNLVTACMRRQMAWAAETNTAAPHTGQYLEMPRAICCSNGLPHNGQKSYATHFLGKRYKNCVVHTLPSGWIADSIILEGMFIINTSPLVSHRTRRDYSNFLINRFVLYYFCKGINEVHIVFDSPGHGMHTPKEFEQNRRDGSQSSEHIHTQFSMKQSYLRTGKNFCGVVHANDC